MDGTSEYSLTGLQYQIYLRELLRPGTSLNNNACVIRYREAIDVPKLVAAIQDVIARHESLHVRFVRLGEDPRYRLVPGSPIAVATPGFEGHADDPEAFLSRFCNAPFDLCAAEPLFRFAILSNSPGEDALAFSIHHLISDGVSVGLILKEIQDRYLDLAGVGNAADGPRLVSFRGVIEAEKEYLRSPQVEVDKRFWLAALEPPFDVADLSMRPGSASRRQVATEHVTFTLPGAELKRLARAARVAPVSALYGSFALTVSKLTGLRRFVIGLAVHNRGTRDHRYAHGPVSNIVPLMLEVDPATAFAAWAKLRVHRGLILSLRHGRYPSFKVLEKLRQRIRLDALFEIVFDFQVERLRPEERGGVELVPNDTQLHPLTVKCTQYGATAGDLEVRLVYQRAAFTREDVENLFARWMTVFRALVREPEIELRAVSLLGDGDLERLKRFGEGPRAEAPDTARVHDRVVEGLRRTPESTALIEAGQRLTAAQLLSRTASLARTLRSHGVGAESIVGLYGDRSFARVLGVLAILRAGAGYCPLDPTQPGSRLQFLVEDTGMAVILTEPAGLGEAEALAGQAVDVVCIDHDTAPAAASAIAPNASEDNTADHLAYVIYTSGTTGNPKGVMTEHRALVNRLTWMQRQFQLTPDDVVLHKTAFAFDVSVWELLWPFMAAAALSLLAPGAERDPAALRRQILRDRVTVLHFVPSALRALLESSGPALPTVRLVVCSGEVLDGTLVEGYRRIFPNARLFNLYGPTEAAIDVSWFDCGAWSRPGHGTVPIGRPIDHVNLYVLDHDGGLVPPGMVGELMIGGVAVARGYRGRRRLTREKFAERSTFSGTRVERTYRTGDLVRWLPDGNLEFLGRNDFQLKIRGHRVEAGEVEARLAEHPGVREAVVKLLRGEEAGEEQLAAFLVRGAEEPNVAVSELRAFLAETLPAVMIPSRFLEIEEMPLTASGKRDHAALQARSKALSTDATYVAASNEREVRWLRVWQETLGRRGIGVNDDFFQDLGGDSLSAVRLVSALNRTLAADELTVADLTEFSTIRRLGERVREPESHTWRRQTFVDLEGEVERVFRSQRPGNAAPYRANPATILLTGATGFVGAYVLHRLLAATRARVICLVRAASRRHARRRVRANLEHYGLYDATVASRIAVVTGDVSVRLLGVADEAYESIAGSCDHVFHFAAEIDHHATYEQLFATNVQSAAEVIDFATHRRLKKVAYASTEDIFSYDSGYDPEIVRDERFDLTTERHRHAAGYAASKWVADEIYRRAAVPICRFRFGIITGDNRSGKMPEYQWLSRLLASCLQLRQRFHTPAHTRLDTRSFITPVDFLARAVVGLTLANGNDDTVFHISSDQAISWDRVLDEIESQAGVEIVKTSVYDWLKRCREFAESDAFLPIHPFIDQEMRMTADEVDASIAARFRGGINVGTERTRKLLEREGGLTFPQLDSYFAAYAERVIAIARE